MKAPATLRWILPAGIVVLAAGLLLAVMLGLAGNLSGRVALNHATLAAGAGPAAAGGAVAIATLTERGPTPTIDAIAAQPDAAWTPLRETFIRSARGEAVWIRVVLQNPSDRPVFGILGESGYYLDVVDFWTRDERAPAGWRHERSGEWIRDKPVWGRSAVFAIQLPPGATQTCYFRVEDKVSVLADFAWWPDRERYAEVRLRIALAEGLYYGALFVLFFYNAVLWVRLRFADTGYYLGYLGAAGLLFFTINGGFPQFITVLGSPAINVLAEVAAVLSAAAVVQFGRVFLELATRAPRADRVARWLRNGVLALLVVTRVFPWDWLYVLIPVIMLAHGTMLVMALLVWRAGATHARYFILAFGCLFAGLAPTVALLVLNRPQHWTMMTFLAGSVMEMLLLSLALADRFARLQRERAAAREQLAEEMAQREMMQEAYADELEIEVGERTRELREANRDKDRMIAVIGHDLRAPLTALMMGAERAAERPDVAPAFAGEVAQTGRQVLLLIEDLVLWARLRAGGVHPGVHRVRDFATQVAALHRPLAAQRGVTLEVSVSETLRVRTDLVLAQTLVRNLVANAVRFARTRVVVGATVVADGVRLTVRDDGPGLPPAVSALLAGTENRATPEPRAGGLGLRLCVEIGRALGVKLEVNTGPDQGAEFSFTLPEVEQGKSEG